MFFFCISKCLFKFSFFWILIRNMIKNRDVPLMMFVSLRAAWISSTFYGAAQTTFLILKLDNFEGWSLGGFITSVWRGSYITSSVIAGPYPAVCLVFSYFFLWSLLCLLPGRGRDQFSCCSFYHVLYYWFRL